MVIHWHTWDTRARLQMPIWKISGDKLQCNEPLLQELLPIAAMVVLSVWFKHVGFDNPLELLRAEFDSESVWE